MGLLGATNTQKYTATGVNIAVVDGCAISAPAGTRTMAKYEGEGDESFEVRQQCEFDEPCESGSEAGQPTAKLMALAWA